MTTRDVANSMIADVIVADKGFKINKEVATKFLALCDLADILNEEFGDDLQVVVQVDAGDVHGLVVVCVGDLLFEKGTSHKFFELLPSADILRFDKEGEMLRVQLGVKDLWVKE